MSDYYFVETVIGGALLGVQGRSMEPDAHIVLEDSKSDDLDNISQQWQFTGQFLINKQSGLVVEAPMNEEGRIEPGTPLIQAERKNSNNENQLWFYNQRDHRLYSGFDNNLCICGQDKNVQDGTLAVVDALDNKEPVSQMWILTLLEH